MYCCSTVTLPPDTTSPLNGTGTGILTKRTVLPAPQANSLLDSITFDTPASILSAACSCISSQIPYSTTTVTKCTTITLPSPTLTSKTYILATAFATVQSTINVTSTTTVSANSTSPTLLPDPNCQGAICGNFKDCGGGDTCSCYSSAEGPGYCALDSVCQGIKTCETSAECGGAAICAVNTCCSDTGVCLALQCGNPGVRLMGVGSGRTSREDGSGIGIDRVRV